MNLIKFASVILMILNDNFVERKFYTKIEIIENDQIGCSNDFIKFNKQLIMSKYKIDYDQINFNCYSVLDHKGVRYTKRVTEIKI